MYFLWRSNSIGNLRISEDAVCRLVDSFFVRIGLSANEVRCRAFAMLDGKRSNGLFVLSAKEKDEKIEELLKEFVAKLGISSKIVYVEEGAGSVELIVVCARALRSPWFWGSVFAAGALVAFVGFGGLFWVSFCGTLGWFTAKVLSLPQFVYWFSRRSTFGRSS